MESKKKIKLAEVGGISLEQNIRLLGIISMYLSSFKWNIWLHELAEVGGDDLELIKGEEVK
jgi:hypothetical protein